MLVSPAVRELIAFADGHPDAGVVGPRLLNPDGSLQPSAYRFPTLVQALGMTLGLKRLVPVAWLRAHAGWWLGRRFGQLDPHAVPRAVDYVTGACMLIRRDVASQLGGFDPRFAVAFLLREDLRSALRTQPRSAWAEGQRACDVKPRFLCERGILSAPRSRTESAPSKVAP